MTAGRPIRVRPGVSLIEVLLATAIFMMALAALMVLRQSANDSATEAVRTNLCSSLARSKMAELEAGVGDVTVSGGGSGTFDTHPSYQWEVASVPTANNANAYDVTVRVWIDTGVGRAVEVSLSQVILDPTLMNNAAPLTAPTPTTTTGTSP